MFYFANGIFQILKRSAILDRKNVFTILPIYTKQQ